MADMAVDVFQSAIKSGVSTGIATIQGLLAVLSSCEATTVQELVHNLRSAASNFQTVDCSCIALKSASDLFTLFITQKEHARLETEDFESCRQLMKERGATFLARLQESCQKIAQVSQPFLGDGCLVLMHGSSTVVTAALSLASRTKDIRVLVTRSSGPNVVKQLEAENIGVTVIEDLAVGANMHKVDCVMLGAEGVVETGGIVNKLGSYTVAMVARALNKQVYVLAESFKFVREYPLGQEDLPKEYLYPASVLSSTGTLPSPRVDYTPPGLVTLLFTDLGILTPSAVSDELINLYL